MTVAPIHQTLHGYDRGHRLLVSSTRLSAEDEERMLVLSDLAGPRQTKGFDEYLTGYPLLRGKSYAFARTWLAHELPRPGCVWTHTLLVPFDALAGLTGADLVSHLRRPSGPDDKTYRTPARISVQSKSAPVTPTRVAANVIHGLYEYPERALWMESQTSELYEALVLAIWTSQWTDLRRAFSFSTGSLAPRRLGDRLMDLQLVPPSQRSVWLEMRGVTHAGSVRPGPWARRAAAALNGAGHHVAEFLSSFGSDGRAKFAPLMHAYLAAVELRGHDDPSRLVGQVAALGLSPSQASRILSFFARADFGLSDVAVLRMLLEPSMGRGAKRADIESRTKNLLRQEPTKAWQVARRAVDPSANSAVGETVLGFVARSIASEQLLDSEEEDWNLVLRLIQLQPRHAALVELWQTSPSTQRQLFETIEASSASADDRSEIVAAIARAGSHGVLATAIAHWPKEAIPAILDFVNSAEKGSIPRSILQTLAADPQAVGHWLASNPEATPKVLLALAEVLDPEHLPSRLPTSRWLVLLDPDGIARGTPRARAFLLRIGLQGHDLASMHLVVALFTEIHRAASKRRLPEEAWHLLEPKLPSLGLLKDWDRCERLRRAIAQTWLANNWPAATLSDACRTREIRKRVRKFMTKLEGGDAYAIALRDPD